LLQLPADHHTENHVKVRTSVKISCPAYVCRRPGIITEFGIVKGKGHKCLKTDRPLCFDLICNLLLKKSHCLLDRKHSVKCPLGRQPDCFGDFNDICIFLECA